MRGRRVGLVQFNRHVRVFSVVSAACASAGMAYAQGGSPLSRLRERHPGVSAIEEEGRVRAVYGRPMTTAATAEEAASRFLTDHGEVFSPVAMDLERFFVASTRDGKKMTFAYTQRIDGVPVEPCHGRVMILDTGRDGPYKVVYAGFDVAAPVGLLPPTLTGEQALAFARVHPRAVGLVRWSTPERVVSWDRPAGQHAAINTWKVTGTADNPIAAALTFFCQCAHGRRYPGAR